MPDDYVKRSELPGIIKDAVREALDEYSHKCKLDVSDADLEQAKFLFAALKEIGHGELDIGITEARENHRFLSRYRSWTGNVGTAVITFIVLGVVGVVGAWVASIAGRQ